MSQEPNITDILPPEHIRAAAEEICQWMTANGYNNWQLGGLCDRRLLDREPGKKEPRIILAARYRLSALATSWRSSALWKMHDAEMAEDENEATACRREAQSFEICAGHVEAWLRVFK